MRCTSENLARMANAEDGCKGQPMTDLGTVGTTGNVPKAAIEAVGSRRCRSTKLRTGPGRMFRPPVAGPATRVSSDRGFLPISVTAYLELLDWTGRQLRSDKVGSIPGRLSPVLRRIGVDARGWCDVVTKFGRIFKRAAGTSESLAGEAIRRGQGWLCAPENPLGLSGG